MAVAVGVLLLCSSSAAVAVTMMGGEETPGITGPGPGAGPSPSSTPSGLNIPSQDSLMSKYISESVYNNMKAQSSPSGVNAYKGNYYHEGALSEYPGDELFTVSSVPGSDWRSKETHCFNKCTDLGDDCRILTFKKDANNNILECSGHGTNAYSTRDTATNRHESYHKRTP